jgi:hypothetical protein
MGNQGDLSERRKVEALGSTCVALLPRRNKLMPLNITLWPAPPWSTRRPNSQAPRRQTSQRAVTCAARLRVHVTCVV